jgi:hypothetical protein
MFCNKCGTQIYEHSVYCSVCGSKLSDLVKPEVVNEVPNLQSVKDTFTSYGGPKTTGLKKRGGCFKILMGLLIFAFLGSFLSGIFGGADGEGNTNPSTEPSTSAAGEEQKPVQPEDLLAALGQTQEELEAYSEGVCKVIQPIIDSSTLATKIDSRTKRMKEVSDAYDAEEFVAQNEWVNSLGQDETVSNVHQSIEESFDSALGNSSFEGAPQLKINYPQVHNAFSSQYKSQVLENCGLTETLEGFSVLTDQAMRLRGLASNVPWYPKGYSEYSDGLTAWKWVDRSCSYYSGRCNHMDVVSAVGCSSLYVEVNFLDASGSVVDWSNDTARGLSAGQTAKLEFVTFGDAAKSADLVEVSCY